MNRKYKITSRKLKAAKGYALPLVLVVMLILIILCFGETMTSYTTRIQAVSAKAETEAMLAAEAGYERSIFMMCQQSDILGWLQGGGGGPKTINFGTSTCSYQVDFHGFLGARPVFEVKSIGKSGRPVYTRVVDVNVMQETSGWAEGSCRIPNGTNSTTPVYFGSGEIISMPVHINDFHTPDEIDIWISTSGVKPRFLQKVEVGESRKTSGGSDKYSSVMSCFESGIDFDQPDIRITDETAVQSKINRFRDSITDNRFKFEPNGTAKTKDPCCSAVQLEFFVQGNVGKVRITNNCTVDVCTPGPADYNIVPGTGGTTFHLYKTYAYHYARNPNDVNCAPKTYNITDTYVSQQFGGYTSTPGGQIYVNGNVIIGGPNTVDVNQVVKGKITVVATGNIWIADNVLVYDYDDAGVKQRDASGMPTPDNPNVLGLIAQGFVKVVDPGLSNLHTADANSWVKDKYYPTDSTKRHYYQPIGNAGGAYNNRYLLDPTVVEAAITCGGGGWGAENVGSRKVYSAPQDDLYVRGSITEVVRGIVGHLGSDGYVKHYYIDTRLMTGILPGDIWFSGKFIPAPAGWHDYGINQQ